MLVLAREAKGLTQTQLAKAIDATQSKISKLEDGLIAVSTDDLQAFCTELGRPPNFFTQGGVSRVACDAFYRKKSALPMRLLNQCDARMNIQRIEIEKLCRDAEMETKTLPYMDPDEFDGPAHIAKLLRRTWQIPRGPIANLTKLVEDAGCVVVHFDFGTKQLDGLSIWGEGKIPIIFLNGSFPADRIRLTLAHELGHIIMHRTPQPDMEDQAFTFAGELLMPEVEIRSSFYPIGLDELARLKLRWRVSMSAILKRGCDLGAIGERYGRFLWMQMGKYGYRTKEPHEDQIPREKPTLLLELVALHLNELGYTPDELAQVLAMNRETFDQQYAQDAIPFRIVK